MRCMGQQALGLPRLYSGFSRATCHPHPAASQPAPICPRPPYPHRCNELQQTVVEVQGQLRLGKSDLGVSCHWCS